MIIREEHASILLNLLGRESEGPSSIEVAQADEAPYMELERANLLSLDKPLTYSLTYWGRGLAETLRELIENGTLKPVEEWDETYRWISSEILLMLESAIRNGDNVSPALFDILSERGFATVVKEEKKGERKVVSEAGKQVFDVFRGAKPRLIIDRNLYELIRKLPEGPGPQSVLPTRTRLPYLLESMRLIAFSVPAREIFAFTGLGKLVRKTLQYVAPTFDTVISEDIMVTLAKLVDEGMEFLTETEIETLQGLAYIDGDGNLLPAGEYLLEVYNLWKGRKFLNVKTIAIDILDAEILKTINSLWEKHETNPEILPTPDEIVNEMLHRPLKEYKHLISYYGRRIYQDIGYQKKKEIEKKFSELKTVEEVFKSFYEKGGKWREKMMDIVRQSLYSLESFQLVESTEMEGKEVYDITDHGMKVLNDMKLRGLRDIPSTSVKAITITNREFAAPNRSWYEMAAERNLVSQGGPTDSGRLYAELAYSIERKPHLTRFELQVLKAIPEKGFFVQDVYNQFDEIWHEEIEFALNKLEARGYIDILPDDGIVLTEDGKLLKKALAGAPDSLGNPINPLMVRVLKAVAQVGTLYVKEKKVRILPRQIQEAIKLSGLEPERFNKELIILRSAKLMGQNTINEAGLMILKLLEKYESEKKMDLSEI